MSRATDADDVLGDDSTIVLGYNRTGLFIFVGPDRYNVDRMMTAPNGLELLEEILQRGAA
jgi:hypothetical protein